MQYLCVGDRIFDRGLPCKNFEQLPLFELDQAMASSDHWRLAAQCYSCAFEPDMAADGLEKISDLF